MHRLATLPGAYHSGQVELVEQPPSSIIFITSANSDISTISSTLKDQEISLSETIRALPIAALEHPAQIDHYINKTAIDAKLILVRIHGGRGHWPYGLEKLSKWVKKNKNRKLIIISGTKDHILELHSIGNVEIEITNYLSNLLIEGGTNNMNNVLSICKDLVKNKKIDLKKYPLEILEDPIIWRWEKKEGNKIGVILYKALFCSGDHEFANLIHKTLKKYGLIPRIIWVGGLKDNNIQSKILDLFKKESVKIILTSTSFASVEFEDALNGCPLWDKLDVPVLQLLTSRREKSFWEQSNVGMDPLDLSMQVVMPELDGRITTRPCAFKIIEDKDENLCTAVHKLKGEQTGLDWICAHCISWIKLQELENCDKKLTIVLANYPLKNGRIANGVGLDTPESLLLILNLLKTNGYYLGSKPLPVNAKDLIRVITKSRTNDPESYQKAPLSYISLEEYVKWWETLPNNFQNKITDRWGIPSESFELESSGFSINGIRFGNITILIQPGRGYDPHNIKDLHSPDLPVPHRYMAQYLWIAKVNKSNAIIHLGKHGSLEWLPGKAVGLSPECSPNICIGYIPNIYPFIVNDPGEGSQSKRRSQAIILDHLTPPLSKSGLTEDLLEIEDLIDEYYDTILLSSTRSKIVKEKLTKLINKNNLRNFSSSKVNKIDTFENNIDDINSYLCDIKDAQIRVGLHIYGQKPYKNNLLNLFLLIANAPTLHKEGFTQWLTTLLGLQIDPRKDSHNEIITKEDAKKISNLTDIKIKDVSDYIKFIDEQAILLIDLLTSNNNEKSKTYIVKLHKLVKIFRDIITKKLTYKYIDEVIKNIWLPLNVSHEYEQINMLKALSGRRVASGPSGAPTRGKAEVLPTGRNFYSIDLRGLPTESAWDLGRRSAENILEIHLMEQGTNLKKLALSVWGTSTMRNGGEDISQLLALMGVKPHWDGSTRRVTGIDVIPLSILNRPRVDVVLRISGLFRDAFPNLIELVNQAKTIVSKLDEPVSLNPLRENFLKGDSLVRVFGSAPGSYGAGIQALIDNSTWESTSDIASAYLAWSKWSYDDSHKVIEDEEAIKSCLKDIEVIMHNQDNREHDILDSDDYYQFHGGLYSVVENLSGNKPLILYGDNSNFNKPKVHTLSYEIDKVMRSRVLNPKWINGIKSHGYKGAFEMSATVDYLFAYDATTSLVPDWCYSKIYEGWLTNKENKEFLTKNNPWALKDIAERLLEANNRNMWSLATINQKEQLKSIVNEMDSIIEKDSY
tara:strand:+ start:1597 stop:5349 length:3753 start_codon:yes stop_codon:yes gene_type:complete